MENLKLLVSLGAPLLGFISTSIILLKKNVKNNKLKKALEKSEEILNHLIPCVSEAEKFINYSGEEKKEYVMTKLNQYAIDNKITFDKEIISNKIEELIEMSKNVNSNAQPEKSSTPQIENKTDDIVNAIQNIIEGLKA